MWTSRSAPGCTTWAARSWPTDTPLAEAVAANRELLAVPEEIAAARAAHPGDDVTSALIAARDEDGDRLRPSELIGTLLLMIIAGHETTLDLVTDAVRALCAHPAQFALVRAGEASWADVVEETLRWDAPVSYFPFRYPVRDLTVAGTLIPAGTPVLAGYTTAGRDPARTPAASTSPGPPGGCSPGSRRCVPRYRTTT